jgi:5-dehydro-2-deoxygluconokinase
MLAADHRWQWEEWCDARAIPRARIADVKRLALDAFLRARERSAAVREDGALLLDQQYASAAIADGVRDGVVVGTPAERAGAFPLAWATVPFANALTGTFVKVLVRHRIDDEESIRRAQMAMLEELQEWCRAAGKPLVVEVLVARKHEDEDLFETTGRPAMLASFIADAYARGLVPDFWKIEGTLSDEGARTIDRAVASHPSGRQIILGKAADLGTIDRWFAATRRSTTAVGFAIGRTVFWDPSAAYLAGTTSRDDAVDAIAERYLYLVDAWQRPRA